LGGARVIFVRDDRRGNAPVRSADRSLAAGPDRHLPFSLYKKGDFPESTSSAKAERSGIWAVVQDAQGRDGGNQVVTLADLLAGHGLVELTDTLDTVPTGWVADVCRGRASTWPPADEYWRDAWPAQEVEPGVLERRAARTAAAVKHAAAQMAEVGRLDVAERSGLTEHRLAQRLKISRAQLADVSFRLWRSTFSEERDRRAGPDANQQKRGQVSRALQAELEKVLGDGNG
jgi:hypothetical protein